MPRSLLPLLSPYLLIPPIWLYPRLRLARLNSSRRVFNHVLPRRCYNCGDHGHFYKYCPGLRTEHLIPDEQGPRELQHECAIELSLRKSQLTKKSLMSSSRKCLTVYENVQIFALMHIEHEHLLLQ